MRIKENFGKQASQNSVPPGSYGADNRTDNTVRRLETMRIDTRQRIPTAHNKCCNLRVISHRH